jgi:hypothetical protein
MSEAQLRLAATGGEIPQIPGPPDADRAKLAAFSAFRSGDPEGRLRDLVAFGLAWEAAKPVAADEIPDFRRKAEAELHANAFRVLHNRVQEIRLEAMTEQAALSGAGAGYARLIVAQMIAMLLFAIGSVIVWWLLIATPEQVGPPFAAAGGRLGSVLGGTAAAIETGYTWLGETLSRLYTKMAGKG